MFLSLLTWKRCSNTNHIRLSVTSVNTSGEATPTAASVPHQPWQHCTDKNWHETRLAYAYHSLSAMQKSQLKSTTGEEEGRFPGFMPGIERVSANCAADNIVVQTVLSRAVFFLNHWTHYSFLPDIITAYHKYSVHITILLSKDQLIPYLHHIGVKMGAVGDWRISILWLSESLSIQPICHNVYFLPLTYLTNICCVHLHKNTVGPLGAPWS